MRIFTTSNLAARARGSILGLVVVAGLTIPISLAVADRESDVATPLDSTESNNLDETPGLGKSPYNLARDTVIAYAEALDREELIAECMSNRGFTYAADVRFPAETVLQIAVGLGRADSFLLETFRKESLETHSTEIEDAARTSPAPNDPRRLNAKTVESLSAGRADAYFQALVGETAEDLEFAREAGRAPAGRSENFATGGCTGEAAQTRSIWDARRQLRREVEERVAAESDAVEVVNARNKFAVCVKDRVTFELPPEPTPADIEWAIAEGFADREEALSALVDCQPIYSSGFKDLRNRASDEIAKEQAATIAEVDAYYAEYEASLRAHPEAFLTYLDQHVSWIEKRFLGE